MHRQPGEWTLKAGRMFRFAMLARKAAHSSKRTTLLLLFDCECSSWGEALTESSPLCDNAGEYCAATICSMIKRADATVSAVKPRTVTTCSFVSTVTSFEETSSPLADTAMWQPVSRRRRLIMEPFGPINAPTCALETANESSAVNDDFDIEQWQNSRNSPNNYILRPEFYCRKHAWADPLRRLRVDKPIIEMSHNGVGLASCYVAYAALMLAVASRPREKIDQRRVDVLCCHDQKVPTKEKCLSVRPSHHILIWVHMFWHVVTEILLIRLIYKVLKKSNFRNINQVLQDCCRFKKKKKSTRRLVHHPFLRVEIRALDGSHHLHSGMCAWLAS